MSAASFLFVHSDVDDANLPPIQFRLLAHLARRAGKDGRINFSVKNMADICGLAHSTIKNALRELTERNILAIEERRAGQTPFRRINPPAEWKGNPVCKTTQVTEKHSRSGNDPRPGTLNNPQRVSNEGNQHVLKKTSTSSDDDGDVFLKHLEAKCSSEERVELILNVNDYAKNHSDALLPITLYSPELDKALDSWDERNGSETLLDTVEVAVKNFTGESDKRLTLVRIIYDNC